MPNHVTTRCIVTGPAAEVCRFRQAAVCVSEIDYIESIDFEKIVPMPEVLRESSKWNDAELGIEILHGKPKPSTLWSYLENPWIQRQGISTIEQLRSWAEKERPDALEHGRKSIDAHLQTGFYDSYDWLVESWGTSSNAYAFEIEHEAPGECGSASILPGIFPRQSLRNWPRCFRRYASSVCVVRQCRISPDAACD